jgi:hypothetical protein
VEVPADQRFALSTISIKTPPPFPRGAGAKESSSGAASPRIGSRRMSAVSIERRRSPGRAILWGWMLCGVLDITSAIIISIASGSTPIRMLQGIAGAVLGPKTFDRGFATAAMGLAMHFLVALTATLVFYALSRRIPAMVEHPVVAGLLFGVFWLLVMYRGVIPLLAALRPLYLSNVVKRPLPALWPLPLLVHMTCVGLPISLARAAFGPRPPADSP